MTDEVLLSDEETYRALLQVMRDVNLTWVAEEVESAVLVGEVEISDAPRLSRDAGAPQENPDLRGIPSLQVTRTRLRPRDQVRLAANALQLVVVESLEMEDEVREALGAEVTTVDDVERAEPQVVVRSRRADPDSLTRIRNLLVELDARP